MPLHVKCMYTKIKFNQQLLVQLSITTVLRTATIVYGMNVYTLRCYVSTLYCLLYMFQVKYPSSGVTMNHTYITAKSAYTSPLYKGVDNEDKWHLI
jgi:hypothetical protein